MDSVILLPSIALGIILLVIYVWRCNRDNKSLDLGVVVNTFLLSSGIVCGLLLMAGCVYQPAKALLKGIDIYIFIGGLAVFVVSAQGIQKDIFSAPQK